MMEYDKLWHAAEQELSCAAPAKRRAEFMDAFFREMKEEIK